jgi:S1-C subfamily serine protease
VGANPRFDYRSGEGAGHGIVLTSAGELLTKTHVIDGATQMQGRLPPRPPQSSGPSTADVAVRRVWSVSAGERPTEPGEFASDGA